MPLPLIWLLLILLCLASLFLNSAVWLWLAAKWCRIPKVSYRRALAATLLLAVIGVTLQTAGLLVAQNAGTVLAVLGLLAVASIICVRQVLHTTTRRAVLAWLISAIAGGVSSLPAVIPFKLYVIEAFTVPTGSMALAVIGKHFDIKCDRCGCQFAVSATTRETEQQRARQHGNVAGRFVVPRGGDTVQLSHCPNCRAEQEIAADQPVVTGDRILVDKIGARRRWDVIAFQMPAERSTSYLKRLVGLPGETVEIIAGDVFINEQREVKPFGVAHDLWVLVNDTRLRPGDMKAGDPQWKADMAGSGWKQDQSGWTFSGDTAEPQTLAFSGPTTDASSFAERWVGDRLSSDERPLECGDLQVRCSVAHFAGDGTLGFHWKFRGHEVICRVAGTGDVELKSDQANQKARLPQQLSKVQTIGFAVRDGMATLVADGLLMTSLTIGPQDAATCRKGDENKTQPCRIAIMAEHCDVALSQIVLERDVYYRNFEGLECHGCTGRPMLLGPQEHFVLGDHSVRANDSRLWQELDPSLEGRFQVGTVPSELMIGVTRCIYWPPARWHAMQ